MRKLELLAPAGDKECLIAAVQNGADAIYLGGSYFNARASAKNFTNEELEWAVSYAHLRDVKIYVAVNTLYKDDEFNELIEYIDYLYDIQVDALIIQDLGLFHFVRYRYPDFEVHMSTQASVMNKYSAKYFENEGARRVVLARENTIEEIKEITESCNIEIEVFVHGALCVSYSGQCLMSSMIGKRSGNRGECAQPCRLQYRLKKDNEILENNPFIISPKDLCTIDNIGQLIEAGVTSFKIEGRMKKPEYVSAVVKAYRKAIDAYISSKAVNLKEEKDKMKQMFNRDYTSGYLFHDSCLSDGLYSGNRGIVIGKVLSYNKKKKRVLIKLSETLKQGDSILFETIDKGRPVNKIYKNNRLVACGERNECIEIEFDYKVENGNARKTLDNELIKKIQKTYDKEYKKVPLDMYFIARLNENPMLKLEYKNINIEVRSNEIADTALKTPLDKERIYKQLNKLGDTPFRLNHCHIEIDNNIIFPIKTINDLRRKGIEELVSKILKQNYQNNEKRDFNLYDVNINYTSKEIDVIVSDISQLSEVINHPVRTVYFTYSQDAVKAHRICKENNVEFGLFIPRIVKSKDLLEIKESYIYSLTNKVIVNEIGALDFFNEKNIILGTGINIYNSYSAQYLNKECILSLEMDKKQINNLVYANKIVQVYGKTENMISEFCPISQFYFNKQIKHCNKCKGTKFSLIDRKNEEFQILTDENCRMHLLNNVPLYFDDLNSLKCSHYLLHFTSESSEMVSKVMIDYFENVLPYNKSKLKQGLKTTKQYLQ